MRIDKPEKLMGWSVTVIHRLTDDEADAPIYVRALEWKLVDEAGHIVPSSNNLSLAVAAHFFVVIGGAHFPSAAACRKRLARCWRWRRG